MKDVSCKDQKPRKMITELNIAYELRKQCEWAFFIYSFIFKEWEGSGERII